VLRGYYDGQMQRYRADRAAAAQLVQVGVAPIDRQLDSAGMAALTNVAAVIMNTPDSYFIR
jgi:hypothetical protein